MSADNPPPGSWLHVNIGRIIEGLESVRGDMGEIRAEVRGIRSNQNDTAQVVTGLCGKIDAVMGRVSEVEEDVKPLAEIGVRLTVVESRIDDLTPRIERLQDRTHDMRSKMMGAMLLICGIAGAIAMLRDLFTVGLHF